MPLSRLFPVAIFLCSSLAFGQQQQLFTGNIDSKPTAPDFRTRAATPSEPWRIIPKKHEDDALVIHDGDIGPDGIVVSPRGRLDADTTCYTLRAYIVARDSKHSDSTHPVGYSTCHPATRYRLKTADAHLSKTSQ
jgi:hypothetical protein